MPSTDSDLRPDERLIFFPTIGRFDRGAGEWQLPIHAWIFKPEDDSRRRAVALGLLRHWLHLEPSDALTEVFEDRMRAFLVDNQPRKTIHVQILGRSYAVGPSAGNGHLREALRLPADTVAAALATQAGAVADSPAQDRWLRYDALLPSADDRPASGRVRLLDEHGTSVISDIDDTIKITHVHDRLALLRQTFLRDFEPVPGMSELYGRWRAAGAAFHYVSRSPWQLYQSLAAFLDTFSFPSGTFHMRFFRWKEGQTLRPDRHGRKKQAVIEGILQSLPGRGFFLVGDSGEHDPEVYGELARLYPRQVRGIFIRRALGRDASESRFREAFAGLPSGLWRVFDDPAELPTALP